VIRQSDQQTVTLTDGVDYTVTDVGEDAGAQVSVSLYETANNITDWTTYDSGPWDLFMTLDIPLTQLIDFIKVGRYNSQLNENMGDKLTQICQLTREGVTPGSVSNLNIQYPDNEPSGVSNKLPAYNDRLSKLAGWDANGEWEAVDLDADNVGGMTGPASQVEGNLAIYSATQGALEQSNNISESLFLSQTLVYGATINWDSSLGHIATLNLSGDPTLNVINIKPGVYKLLVNQDVTGGRTITFNTGFGNTAAVALNTDSNGFSSLAFTSDGTTVYFDGSSSAAQAAAGLVGTYQDFAYDISSVEDDIGYLRCNGQAVSRTKYADLFGVLGTTYGVGDGSTTFDLPDLETDGRFRRSTDGVTVIGNTQLDTTAANGLATVSDGAHDHDYLGDSDLPGVSTGSGGTYDAVSANMFTDSANGPDPHTHQISVNTGALNAGQFATSSDGSHTHGLNGDAETRPNNIICMVGIKF